MALPHRTLFYQPGYKRSRKVNDADTSESGRNANTVDGGRHWQAKAGLLDQLCGWGPRAGLPLYCDHPLITDPIDALLAAADTATPGKPTRRTVS